MTKAKSAIFIAALATLMLSALVLCTGIGIAESSEEIQEPTASAPEYMGDIEELAASAKDLKKLVNQMEDPAHEISGDVGAKIHTQFHRCEGFAVAIYDNVDELEKLAADPEKNEVKIREMVVETLYGQVNTEWGKFSAVVGGMSELIEQALEADPEDENALKVQEVLLEIEDAQFEIDEQVKELGEKVQDPIVWEYKCMSPANPHRLENGNTLIAEHVGDRIIEVTLNGEIVWEYNEAVITGSVQKLVNDNILISDYVGNRIIEVSPNEEIVWEYTKVLGPSWSQRLDNSNTLIADTGNQSFIEVTQNGEIVWEYSEGIVFPYVAQRLANGNTILGEQFQEGFPIGADFSGQRVFEVTSDKELVWEYCTFTNPAGFERLENGNTLIGDFFKNRVIEVAAA